VKVNNISTPSGSASSQINLNVGSNTINVLVTAQDGSINQTYTITVTRAASTNANLSSLAISQGTLSPSFASGTTSYSVSVGSAVYSLNVAPTIADANATVIIKKGTSITSGSASNPIALNVGLNTISVMVTAQDGSTMKSYTIIVTRASEENTLKSITLSEGILAFSSEITSYEVPVGNLTTAITVTAAAYDPSASIKVNGITTVSGGVSIKLNDGYNLIQVEVTPQGFLPKLTYTIKVSKPYSKSNLHLLADINGDGKVRIDDLLKIMFKSPEERINYDLNLDGHFDNADILMMLDLIDGI
jgi:hypothetical protein